MGQVSKPDINRRIGAGCICATLIALCVVGCTAGMVHRAHAQPDGVICTEDGEYERCTPGEVIQAGDGAFAADVQTLETQIVSTGKAVAPLRATGTTGQVLTFDPTIQGANYGWKDSSGGGSPLSDSDPKPLGGSAAAGASADASRGDHVHPVDGIRQVSDPSTATDGHVLTKSTSDGSAIYGWAAPTGGGGKATPLSDNSPKPLGDTAAPGTASAASRGDHVHPHTGLRLVPGQSTHKVGDVLTLKSGGYDWATRPTVRQVPDPAHQSDGDVLTVESGAAVWKAGGGGGAAGWEITQLGTSTNCNRDECEFVLGAGTAAPDDNCGDTACKILTGDLLTVVGPPGSNRDQALETFSYVGSATLPTGTKPETVTVNCTGGLNYFHFDQNHQFCVFTNAVYFFDSSIYRDTGTWTLWRLRPAGGGGGGSTSLSDGTPAALGTASPGAGTAASRGDHVHPIPADIAANKAAIATNNNRLKTTESQVATQGEAIETNKAGITANANAIKASKFPGFSDSLPHAPGIGNPGAADRAARADHTHPAITGWVTFLSHTEATIQLENVWVWNEVFTFPAPANVHAAIQNNTARVRGFIFDGQTAIAQCGLDSNGSAEYRTDNTGCTGSDASHITKFLYQGAPSGNDQEQGIEISFDDNRSGKTYRVVIESYIAAPTEDVLVWSTSQRASTWGSGHPFDAGLSRVLYNGITGAVPWEHVEVEIAYSETKQSVTTHHYAVAVLAGRRQGDINVSDPWQLWGQARIHSSTLYLHAACPVPNNLNSERCTLTIANCSFCTSGNEQLAIRMYGVR